MLRSGMELRSPEFYRHPAQSCHVNSGPQSSHLPNGESNLQSDSSQECIGHTAVIEHTTFSAHFIVSSWRAGTPLDFSLYPSHPTNG